MITKEKLEWLRQNKIRGDIAAVVEKLNPKQKENGVTYSEAASIINGNLWGKYGELVTDCLENIITNRVKKIAKEKRKYAKA